MRGLSKLNKAFSFVFMSYYRDKQTTKGLVAVNKAMLRASTKKTSNKNTDYMLNYTDLETGKPRQFYQVTLMYFNGMKITVK